MVAMISRLVALSQEVRRALTHRPGTTASSRQLNSPDRNDAASHVPGCRSFSAGRAPGRQILIESAVELIPDDNARHINGRAGDLDEGQQSLFYWAAHPNPEKAASTSRNGLLTAPA